jgi:drug/metabolite transporter (DMT)-like permease
MRISEVGPQATNFWRFAFSMPALLMWVALTRGSAPTRPQIGWLLFAGLLFGAELGLVGVALHYTTVANVSLLSNMTSIFAALFGWLLFRERPGVAVLAGAGTALVGAVALSLARAQAHAGSIESAAGWLGDALSFASAAGYAGYLLILRRLGASVPTSIAVFWVTLSALIYALIASLLMRETIFPQTWHGWLTVIVLGFGVHTAAQSLIAFGVARLPIAVSTVMLWLQPLVAAVISWIWFGEALGTLAFAGAALILSGVYVVQRARS